ncbi:hypothetical protein ABK040_014399 [Willaertia magna]
MFFIFWLIVKLLDGCIYMIAEYTKTLIRELLHLFGYLLDLTINFILYFFKSSAERLFETSSSSGFTLTKSSSHTSLFNSNTDLSSLVDDFDETDDNKKGIAEGFSRATKKPDSFRRIIEKALKKRKAAAPSIINNNASNQLAVNNNTFSVRDINIAPFTSQYATPIVNISVNSPTIENGVINLQTPSVGSTTDSEQWIDYDQYDSTFDDQYDIKEDMKLINEEQGLFYKIIKGCRDFILWLNMLVIYVPTLFRRSIKTNNTSFETEKVHLYEKKSTGLLEDLFDAIFVFIDELAKSARYFIRFQFRNWFTTLKESFSLFKISNFLSTGLIDDRSINQVIIDNGFESKTYYCATEDGYKVQLNRIPNRKSKTVVYFQHGILDSGFAWIGSNPNAGLACAANGYDVFLGNLRGYGLAGCHGKHKNPNITKREYWDFSINEHAFYDVKAFIQKIRALKKKELGNEDFKLIVVAHSMGAACTLAYMSWEKANNREHYIDKAILLSPAGNHQKIPRLLYYLSFTIPIIRRLPFWNYFGFTSKTKKILASKLIQDINNHSATKSLLSALISKLILGGMSMNNPFGYVHNLVYHTFNATSVKVVEHLIQISKSGIFQAYDYGKRKNLEVYGTEKPFQMYDYYNKLDIPIYIVYADDDRVIPKQCVLRHFKELQKYHPNTVHARKFKNIGHLELTLSSNDAVIRYILKILSDP